MDRNLVDAITSVLFMIIGIAALSVILSPKAHTVQTIQAAASGFSNSLGTAMSPVTGADIHYDTSYSRSFFGL